MSAQRALVLDMSKGCCKGLKQEAAYGSVAGVQATANINPVSVSEGKVTRENILGGAREFTFTAIPHRWIIGRRLVRMLLLVTLDLQRNNYFGGIRFSTGLSKSCKSLCRAGLHHKEPCGEAGVVEGLESFRG